MGFLLSGPSPQATLLAGDELQRNTRAIPPRSELDGQIDRSSEDMEGLRPSRDEMIRETFVKELSHGDKARDR